LEAVYLEVEELPCVAIFVLTENCGFDDLVVVDVPLFKGDT